MNIRQFLLMLATSLAAGLLFVNIYTSLVDAVNWGSDIPNSIQTARDYYKTANPGTFFRLFAPITQIVALLAVIFCWKSGSKLRTYTILAFVLTLAGDAFTFGYFYPRNDILFMAPIDTNLEAIKTAWSEWSSMNWLRSLLVLVILVIDFMALKLTIPGFKKS